MSRAASVAASAVRRPRLPVVVPALLLAGWVWTAAAVAGTHRLDDTLSHTMPANAQMQWRPISASEPGAAMQAWVRVNIHIDTREWAGRSGRIFMVMEPDAGNAIEAVWTTLGRLLPGRLTPGERSLVFAGTVPDENLQDQLQLQVRTGPDWATAQRRLQFHFEIDTDR